jgi:hypothetical protein
MRGPIKSRGNQNDFGPIGKKGNRLRELKRDARPAFRSGRFVFATIPNLPIAMFGHTINRNRYHCVIERQDSMSDLLAFAQRILASQPFSVLLGAQVTAFEQGQAELTVPITQSLTQQFGFVHGGVISYAADNALAFAGGSMLGPEVVTSEYKINYIE